MFFIKRYWLAELWSLIGTFAAAYLMQETYNTIISKAFAGSTGAFIGFYLVMYLKENKELIFKRWFNRQAFNNLLIEFGLSELLDVLIIRPTCLMAAQTVTGSFSVALISGNLAANGVFFVLSAFMYSKRETITNRLID